MWEQYKNWIIGIVIILAVLNVVAVYYKVLKPKLDQQAEPSPFQQSPEELVDDNRMSMVPKTQPFVTAPQYGGYEKLNEESYSVQDYDSWSTGWERNRNTPLSNGWEN